MTIETTTATDETRAGRNWRTLAGGGESAEGSAALLYDVWMLTTTHETRVVVFASASTSDADAVHRVAPGTELVIITGPSLATSLDAALLAGVCDGLVIVAESGVTASDALKVAAERARIAGCRILGVVMRTTRRRLPDWISRLMRTERVGTIATLPTSRSRHTSPLLP